MRKAGVSVQMLLGEGEIPTLGRKCRAFCGTLNSVGGSGVELDSQRQPPWR